MRSINDRAKRGSSAGAASIIAAGLIAIGLGGFVRSALAQDAPVSSELAGEVAQARARGLAEVTINATKVRRTGPGKLSDLGDRWSVVLAEPVASVTTVGDIWLHTWYTFRVEEFLRRQAVIPDPAAELRAPRGIEPPRDGQVLLVVGGGDLQIQGVMVHQLGLRFEAGTRYVLNVRLGGGDRVSMLAAPPDAGFAVGRDGALAPLRGGSFSYNLALAGVKDLGRLREVLRGPTR